MTQKFVSYMECRYSNNTQILYVEVMMHSLAGSSAQHPHGGITAGRTSKHTASEEVGYDSDTDDFNNYDDEEFEADNADDEILNSGRVAVVEMKHSVEEKAVRVNKVAQYRVNNAASTTIVDPFSDAPQLLAASELDRLLYGDHGISSYADSSDPTLVINASLISTVSTARATALNSHGADTDTTIAADTGQSHLSHTHDSYDDAEFDTFEDGDESCGEVDVEENAAPPQSTAVGYGGGGGGGGAAAAVGEEEDIGPAGNDLDAPDVSTAPFNTALTRESHDRDRASGMDWPSEGKELQPGPSSSDQEQLDHCNKYNGDQGYDDGGDGDYDDYDDCDAEFFAEIDDDIADSEKDHPAAFSVPQSLTSGEGSACGGAGNSGLISGLTQAEMGVLPEASGADTSTGCGTGVVDVYHNGELNENIRQSVQGTVGPVDASKLSGIENSQSGSQWRAQQQWSIWKPQQ